MADSESRFAAMPARQKATVVIFLLIAVFVVWQVIGMFRGSSSETITEPTATAAPAAVASMGPKPTPTPTPTGAAPQAPPGPGMHPTPANPSGPGNAPPPAAPRAQAKATAEQSKPVVEKAPPPSAFAIQQEKVQAEYVTALNNLQMLKIQKEMAETNQAIVAAKLATATAERTITDMLTPPSMAMPPNGRPGSSTNLAPLPPPATQGEPVSISDNKSYTVQSVTMLQDQWHAVLKYKDSLYDVAIGDVLPPDGSTVKAIDQNSVTLDTGGVSQKIPLTMTDNVPSSSTSSGQAASAAAEPAK